MKIVTLSSYQSAEFPCFAINFQVPYQKPLPVIKLTCVFEQLRSSQVHGNREDTVGNVTAKIVHILDRASGVNVVTLLVICDMGCHCLR